MKKAMYNSLQRSRQKACWPTNTLSSSAAPKCITSAASQQRETRSSSSGAPKSVSQSVSHHLSQVPFYPTPDRLLFQHDAAQTDSLNQNRIRVGCIGLLLAERSDDANDAPRYCCSHHSRPIPRFATVVPTGGSRSTLIS